MLDNTKAKVFWIAVGLSAATIVIGVLWGIFSEYVSDAEERKPTIRKSITSTTSMPAPIEINDESNLTITLG